MNEPRFPMVVALDRSEYAPIVLEHALDQAARHQAPDLHIVTVVDGDADFPDAQRALARLATEELDAFHINGPERRTRLHVRRGKPADEIVALAGDVRAGLIVVGRFAHDTAERVLARAPCPTLVVQLTDIDVVPAQCPLCVAVRHDSDGERWFCDRHTSDHWMVATVRFPIATGWDRGGPML
jgi:nucleotide-binding universal stress UspA family protein